MAPAGLWRAGRRRAHPLWPPARAAGPPAESTLRHPAMDRDKKPRRQGPVRAAARPRGQARRRARRLLDAGLGGADARGDRVARPPGAVGVGRRQPPALRSTTSFTREPLTRIPNSLHTGVRPVTGRSRRGQKCEPSRRETICDVDIRILLDRPLGHSPIFVASLHLARPAAHSSTTARRPPLSPGVVLMAHVRRESSPGWSVSAPSRPPPSTSTSSTSRSSRMISDPEEEKRLARRALRRRRGRGRAAGDGQPPVRHLLREEVPGTRARPRPSWSPSATRGCSRRSRSSIPTTA